MHLYLSWPQPSLHASLLLFQRDLISIIILKECALIYSYFTLNVAWPCTFKICGPYRKVVLGERGIVEMHCWSKEPYKVIKEGRWCGDTIVLRDAFFVVSSKMLQALSLILIICMIGERLIAELYMARKLGLTTSSNQIKKGM